ncbi:hypothetical protein L0663_05165 [Dyadobacter sp. CY107]|uniref:hypothetical protein n=1 Tax=Dyadobacter fanqingshengii TaxID=2906443 RepID=UPI001F3FCE3B|nr:hypothetical protein [Dyadobacter fanqingshengii]MCF2502757.1 hypothetical protein [Dyadobacter fanqingshengii]
MTGTMTKGMAVIMAMKMAAYKEAASRTSAARETEMQAMKITDMPTCEENPLLALKKHNRKNGRL